MDWSSFQSCIININWGKIYAWCHELSLYMMYMFLLLLFEKEQSRWNQEPSMKRHYGACCQLWRTAISTTITGPGAHACCSPQLTYTIFSIYSDILIGSDTFWLVTIWSQLFTHSSGLNSSHVQLSMSSMWLLLHLLCCRPPSHKLHTHVQACRVKPLKSWFT